MSLMNPMRLLRVLLLGLFLRWSVADDDGGGAALDDDTATVDDNDEADAGDDDTGETKPTSLEALTAALADDTADQDDDGETPDAKPPAEGEASASKDAQADDGKPPAKKDGEEDADAIFAKPDSVKDPKASERWDKLVAYSKESREKLAQASQRVDAFDNLVRLSQATPEEFSGLVNYSALLHSGTEQGLRQALNIVEDQRAMLCRMLGEEGPGIDLLADFPQLKARVDNMEITREDALTIARSQQVQQQHQHQAAQQRQQHDQVAQFQQQVATAADAISRWEQQVAASDINYPALAATMQERAQWAARNLPPHLWLADAQEFYRTLQRTTAAARPAPSRDAQPMRSSRAGGGQRTGPRSSLDVINAVLDGE